MRGSTPGAGERVLSFAGFATAVLDDEGTVLFWSQAATELVGWTAEEVCGRPVRVLLADASPSEWPAAREAGVPAGGRVLLRHRSGGSVEVTFEVLRSEHSAECLVLIAPTAQVTDREQGANLLCTLLAQDRIGISVHDVDLTVVRTNIASEKFGGSALPPGSRLADVMSPQDAETAETTLRRVLETGVPLTGRGVCMPAPHTPPGHWTSLSAFRLDDAEGAPTGVVAMFTDTPAQQRALRELDLLHEAATRIGGSLDVVGAAQDLADVVVSALGDLAWVNLANAVFEGDEPPRFIGGRKPYLRRAAVASRTGPWPAALLQVGESAPPLPYSAALRDVQHGRTVILDRAKAAAALSHPGQSRQFIPERGHSGLWAPLFARGLVLGSVTVWRTEQPDPFDEEDAELVAEIASRAALSVDNARRYTREHRSVLALQQSLLPPPTTDSLAAETAGYYLPAGGGADISGDWYDVIPLPSFRVAMVVGDVFGHGLYATATMGRLRTAVRTLTDLELDPTELLTHLDDLVQQLVGEAETGSTVGATCLYVLYNPVSRRCGVASAGHPPPVVVRPDGTVEVIDVSPGPPLGVGGMPFETTVIDLEPGSVLALYTDGLIERDDVDGGLMWLKESLAVLCRPDRALSDTGRALLPGLGDPPPRDDIALLLARTRAVPADNVASWEFAAEPEVVATARQAAAEQLAAWGLEEVAFTTELVVSELVTNAVRYAGGPIGLRLIRENVLVCEVTDPSNTQPRLRRARWTDEGGRGLFLVAQLTNRWGSRYGPHGKTIWAEQSLVPDAIDFAALM
ncbi:MULTISPECIES: SpoIIE family protein phosphatase [Streptomyces]|uniref:PAS domain S-box protein n=1 Tax=Streptomyces dengpaensis TaxID=2049881 RepID=A0ABM6T0C8_9ACTN|nr:MULTISPECIES: SpoIIE family protein phosphatase [Streptomyces]AVH60383.1 PAS domain S-box protein [Streptomyces dengpaensis]PIA98569.1 protein phosphatase [Streptomyces sp. HG99]